jgi:DNA-binding transcriptional MerR regulator
VPITDELKSINRLEAAGFTHDQAKAIVEVTEDAVQRSFEKFVEVLDRKLSEMEQRLKMEIQGVRLEMQTMRADLLKEQRDQVLRFAGLVTVIVAAVTGTIGIVLKFL